MPEWPIERHPAPSTLPSPSVYTAHHPGGACAPGKGSGTRGISVNKVAPCGAWILAVSELVPSGNEFPRQHSGSAQSGISLSEGGDRKAICLDT